MDSQFSDNRDLQISLAEINQWLQRTKPELNSRASIQELIDKIDRLISIQLDEIFHHPDFQELESAWRGLYHLVANCKPNVSLKIFLFNASKKDLIKDTERAVEFYQSSFFRLIAAGAWGQVPFGLLLGVYQFGYHPSDLALLDNCAKIGSALQTPFISAPFPTLFQMKNFIDFYGTRDAAKIFDQVMYRHYVKWDSICRSNESNYLGLCFPRILMRQPYGDASIRAKTFNYNEKITDQNSHYLWGNAAFALALKIAQAFNLYHWSAEITGKENGLINEFPQASVFADFDEIVKTSSSSEIIVPEHITRQMIKLGFICPATVPETGEIFFPAARSVRSGDKDLTPINSQWTHFQYILTASRFAHYLKRIVIENEQKISSLAGWENFLNRWIMQYVGNPPTAEKPLAEAFVKVESLPHYPEKPCLLTAFIKPGFQLPELLLPMRLEIRPFYS